MNALTDIRKETGAKAAPLQLFALFHCNLAFSSIEEEDRSNVIERCYWPLLRLCETHGPIGIEATGFTLEEIEKRDPAWIAQLRALMARGKAELIGSGYAQIIGPLVPSKLVEQNLLLGQEVYERLLGARPKLALVNEQAYSAGLVGHYLDAGFDAILMDWDNPSSIHPEWNPELRYHAARALGADGRSIGLVWTNTVAFQKLQRFVHGDISRGEYMEFLSRQAGPTPRAFCAYASDGEIFGYRPGRYKTEERLSGDEWLRMEEAFAAMENIAGAARIAPSEALRGPVSAQTLRLESAAWPIQVKKQRKYNLTRWAVTGRDDLAINAACQRIFEALLERGAKDDWKQLCRLWASDFRTHITEKRWSAYREELAAAEARLGTSPEPAPAEVTGAAIEERYIDIQTPSLRARLDRRRGLAIQSLGFAPDFAPIAGGLPHGTFDDIALQADWYTGDCVLESPGAHKVTDLEWAKVTRSDDAETGDILLCAVIGTPMGQIEKHMRFHARAPKIGFDILFHWPQWSGVKEDGEGGEATLKGSLRLGHITLLPEAWDRARLTLATQHGGAPETFALAGARIDHGAPVSFLVSASCGLGLSEGWAEISDGAHGLRIEVDRKTAPLLGLLTHKDVAGGLFCQLQLSALELDDTSRPTPYMRGKSTQRRARFSVIGVNSFSRN